MSKFFIISAVFLQITLANKLPAYIHRCQISDPKFHDCVRESTNKALWSVLEGDKTFGFPELLPFKLPPFNFDLSENVNFKLTNGVADVARDTTYYTDVHFDFDKKTAFFAVKTSQLKWYVDYESSGKLAGKPFHEMGKANITFDNIELNTTLSFGFKEVDGKKYIEALSGDTVTTSTKFNFLPYNQVSQGEAMTDEQIAEYKPFFKLIGLAVRKEAKTLTTQFTISELNIAFKAQPFDEIFLP